MRKSMFLLALSACLAAAPALADTIKVPVNKVNAEGIGEEIGTITFVDVDGGVDILVDLAELAPGEHGMHIHANPSCLPAVDKDGKMVPALAAGGHWDPADTKAHMGPGKAGHKGDLPFVTANAEGKASEKLNAGGLSTADLRNHSVMIHAGGDNYSDNPPLGGGGARFACGVIK